MESTQLSEAFEANNSDDNKISEDLVEIPALENSKDDIELLHNDVEYLSETTAVIDSGEHGKISDAKVYAICCALVVLYKLYNLNM